ncbi:MAG: hypothetical protein GY927_00385 [bacterium]|nr:hypothetical protein [bacterium]
MARSIIVNIIVCAMAIPLAVLSIDGAYSQTAKPKSPKGQRLVSSNWVSGCKSVGADNKLYCQATQTISIQKTKQALIVLIVTPWKQKTATDPYLLRIRVPHGTNIPAGVRIQIDNKPFQRLAVITSTAAGLFARIGLSKKLLSSMEKGAILKVGFNSLNGKKILVPSTLKGFGSIIKKLN